MSQESGAGTQYLTNYESYCVLRRLAEKRKGDKLRVQLMGLCYKVKGCSPPFLVTPSPRMGSKADIPFVEHHLE